jgi:hypothetical protein
MKLSILAGSTSQTVNIWVQNSTSTTGAALTGLVFNSAGLTAYYALSRAAAVSITLATLGAVTSSYSSGGFIEIDATNMPGWYRFDIPDAALASGRFVSLHLAGATNMAPLPIEIELTATNNQSATSFITGINGLAPPTAWNTDVVQSGDAYARIGLAGVGLTNLGDSRIANLDATVSSRTKPADTQAAVTTVTTVTNLTNAPTAGDFTATMKTSLNASTPASITGAVASVTGNVGGNVVGSVASVTGAVGSVTGNVGGNVTGSVGSVVGAVGSVTGAVGSVTGNIGGNVVGTVASVVGAVGSVTGNVGGNVTGSVASVLGAVGSVTGAVGSVTGAVGSVTGNVGGNVVGSVASVTGNVSGSVASVVADCGITQAGADKVFSSSGATMAELSQAQPSATPRPDQAIMLLHMALRNNLTTTASTKSVFNNAGTVIAKKALSDDGTTYTETKMVTGP